MIMETSPPPPPPATTTTTMTNGQQNGQQEISRMLNKLRTLVPGIRPEQKMSKLEIMQHVIDYINDLETVLDQPSSSSSSSTTNDVTSTTNSNGTMENNSSTTTTTNQLINQKLRQLVN